MTSDKLNQAIQLIRAGNKQDALPILSEIVQIEPNNEAAWIWLFVCVDSISQKKYCLQKVLEINPNNQNARNELDKLSITKPLSSTLQSLRSSVQSQSPDQDQQNEKKTGNNSFLLKKFSYYLLMIIGSSALIMTCLIVNSINNNKSDLRNFETTQTQGSIIATTQTPTQLSPMNKIVDGYLTAIENEDWQVAYTYLCAEIQRIIPSPLNMSRRIFAETSGGLRGYFLPDSHTILPPPDRQYRVQFNTAGLDWTGGPYEARLEKNSLKICGVGLPHGDLRYLLLPGTTPLAITP